MRALICMQHGRTLRLNCACRRVQRRRWAYCLGSFFLRLVCLVTAWSQRLGGVFWIRLASAVGGGALEPVQRGLIAFRLRLGGGAREPARSHVALHRWRCRLLNARAVFWGRGPRTRAAWAYCISTASWGRGPRTRAITCRIAPVALPPCERESCAGLPFLKAG
jgi:hypothetical protein